MGHGLDCHPKDLEGLEGMEIRWPVFEASNGELAVPNCTIESVHEVSGEYIFVLRYRPPLAK
jgi:hypothetical protein